MAKSLSLLEPTRKKPEALAALDEPGLGCRAADRPRSFSSTGVRGCSSVESPSASCESASVGLVGETGDMGFESGFGWAMYSIVASESSSSMRWLACFSMSLRA